MYKDWYMNAQIILNHIIVERILANQNKLLSQKFAGFIESTTLINYAVPVEIFPLISIEDLAKARVYISNFSIDNSI